MKSKQEIRSEYLKLRQRLTLLEYEQLNKKLCSLFFSFVDLSAVKCLHIFLPIVSKKEPNTWLIIDRLKKDFLHVRISIPKIDGEDRLISFYFEGKQQIAENQWGIPEPKFGKETPTQEIDLVIVPLLAFDKKGHRVGYGKGYYDRFIAQCRPDCKKVGLSFFESADLIPSTKHDIALNYVVTPSQVHVFNP